MTLVKVNNSPLHKSFSNLLDGFFNEFPLLENRELANRSFGFPPVNIHETKDAYHLELNVPGRAKEDFKVQVVQDLLTISYEKKEEAKSDDYKTVRREFSYQSFSRSFNLENVDAEKIQAKYDNGVLKLLLPKKEQQQPQTKQISID